jgi:hypothetical protein
VGIYLGQMPPAEMARLKAEIAETLIANFTYPRFYDYRTNALRMRPVDRAKRQEVWTFLSSFDFNTFSRIDVTSPDFQRQVERLLIQFVQRNRAFFGQQGRKRMSDVRALITNSSASVTEGLRGHLSGHATTPFGSARLVTSWSKTNGSGQLEPAWEQISSPTMLLQQQLQEVRGETRPVVNGDARPAALPPAVNGAMTNGATAAPPRRSSRLRATTQGSSSNETAAPPARPTGAVPPTRPIPQDEMRPVNPSSGPLSRQASGPLAPQTSSAPASAIPSIPPIVPGAEAARSSTPADQRVLRSTIAGDAPAVSTKFGEKAPSAPARPTSFPGQVSQPADSLVSPVAPPLAAQPQSPAAFAAAVPQRDLTRTEPLSPTLANQKDGAKVMASDEDVVIFEEMRHQLIVWLRVEVIRAGVDLTGQTPAQLLEVLGQQDGVDETRLQIISTLLGLANQVIANGYATLVEYKQAMMFYLIHTRRTR